VPTAICYRHTQKNSWSTEDTERARRTQKGRCPPWPSQSSVSSVVKLLSVPEPGYASAIWTSSGKWSDALRTTSGVLRTSHPVNRDAYFTGVNT